MSAGRALASLSASELDSLRSTASAIKLVFFDVDGTLVNSNRQIPPSAIKAIQSLQARGISTAIASGRPPFAVDEISHRLGLGAAGLFYTGAMLYQPAGKRVLAEHPLDLAHVQKIVTRARAAGLHCELYTDKQYYSESLTPFTDYHTTYLGCSPCLQSFDPVLATESIYKVLLVAGCSDDKQRVNELVAAFPDLEFATGHGPDRPDIAFVSIVSRNACKRAAFRQLCAIHGVSASEVMSFGDAQSDQAFLELAGVGIAMGNASDEVKATGNYVAGHVDADGLAEALQCLF